MWPQSARVEAFSPTWPMTYLQTFGPRADPVTALAWGLIAISCIVVVIMAALVIAGVVSRRVRGVTDPTSVSAAAGEPGLRWIYLGLAPTLLALLIALLWTLKVVAAVNSPARKPALTLEVTGHQWWWEVIYDPDKPATRFATANEIHIPVGQPVLVKVEGADVIHSFWVPSLTGKTDAIPGQHNIAWLEADRPGIYRGQCTEYCGEQHAHMALFVVAEPPAAFKAWQSAQLNPARQAQGPSEAQGQSVFFKHCSACHTIRGTEAGGIVGPDLTHLASRRTIAAGTLPNTPYALSGWIANPQAIKPGVKMPATDLSGPDLAALRAYLETLQ